MKAIIAVPPVHDFYFTPSRASALGAEALKRVLAGANMETVIFNFPAMTKKSGRIPMPEELDHLKPHLVPAESGPLSFFREYRRFGPEFPECANYILKEKPDIIFISCFAWAYADEAIALAAAVKKQASDVPVAAGGAGVTVNPAYFEKSACFDYIIPGEAEKSVPVFLQKKLGLGPMQFSDNDDPGFIWSETGISLKKNIRFISAVLSRGCPKACRFCANYLVHGRKFRKTSLENAEREIGKLSPKINISMNFEDDNLTFDMDYFLAILHLVKKRFPGAFFSAENGLDYTFLDTEKIKILVSSGFRAFNFSMASSSSQVLSDENRPADARLLESVVKAAAEAGVPSTTYFICGLENDTVESAIENLVTLHDLPTLTGISMFYPVPGLQGFPPEKMSGTPPVLCAGSSAYPWNNSLTTGQLVTAFRLARLSNLVKTCENRIKAPAGRLPGIGNYSELLAVITKTGRLHTISGKAITPVREQDPDMTALFLDRVLTKDPHLSSILYK